MERVDADCCAVYRMNTYPLVHHNVFSATLYSIVLVPLMERFEAEHGTLLTGALFFGRMWDEREW